METKHKIVPCLWFDNAAEEAAEFYTGLFPGSSLGRVLRYSEVGKDQHRRTPGSVMTVDFRLAGLDFTALNGGPGFRINPSVSFFVYGSTPEAIEGLHEKLSAGGRDLMPLGKYPFSEKYAWTEDRFGLSWQLFLGEPRKQKIAPCLLFTGGVCGRAEEAMNYYSAVFPDSKIEWTGRYGAGQEPNREEMVNYAAFRLHGMDFVAMESALDHGFGFSEAVSFMVLCGTQREIDFFWEKLSADPAAEVCGWLKDRYGVSWQVVPAVLDDLLEDPDRTKADRVMEEVMASKKLDLSRLLAAHRT